MKDTNTKSDNELIAEFMGVQVYKTYKEMQNVPIEKLGIWSLVKQLDYHTNWDRLMPVVEKISRHVYETYMDNNGYKNVKVSETAFPRTFAMLDSEGRFMVRFNRMTLFQDVSLIKATYEAVVEFIKYYNQNNPQE